MVPYVFVSSTIEDLHHLREAISDAISELGYLPVMSERGGVGFLAGDSVTDSCYQSVQECQVAVIIIGKRYGSIDKDERSVTHNEFRVARKKGIPIICLVHADVLEYERVHSVNEGELSFPGMDLPLKTFEFIQEILEPPKTIAVLRFTSSSEAKSAIKTQLAHLVGDWLRKQFDPLAADVKDILAEIKTLRRELPEADRVDSRPFMRGIRFLLNQQNTGFHDFLESLFGTLEEAVPVLLQSTSFADFVEKATHKPLTTIFSYTLPEVIAFFEHWPGEFVFSASGGITRDPENREAILLGISRDGRVVANESYAKEFEEFLVRFRNAAQGQMQLR